MRHSFEFHLGDWSDDGHGKHVVVRCRANGNIDKVREAFHKAASRLPDYVCPTEMCSEYEDNRISEQAASWLKKHGAPRPKKEECTLDWMARYVIWFINQGNPDLEVRRVKSPPTLHFYGMDERGRHIGFIGYGLF